METPMLFGAEADPALPPSWRKVVGEETTKPYFQKLQAFVAAEREKGPVYPPEGEVYTALRLTPFERVEVLLLGQDPYHGPGQAQGLAFSVRPGVALPPSLRNIFKELRDDVGCKIPKSGSLVPWAERGVLLLNAVLTVRGGQAGSHRGKGWEIFTDEIIRKLSARKKPLVFLLWGAYAQAKVELIDAKRHTVLQSPHPSPLSARTGFFGSRPFSKANRALRAAGEREIDWCLASG